MIEQIFSKYELENFYSQAQKNIKRIISVDTFLQTELEVEANGEVDFKNSSISIVLSHNLIPTPSIKINIKFVNSKYKNIGYYALYLDFNRNFLDEFFVIY